MKINGALKPRQGASRQGSSPGVIPKVNENVANSLPRSACGLKSKHSIDNIYKINNIYINNQQQQQQQITTTTTSLHTQQLKRKRQSENENDDENFSGSIGGSLKSIGTFSTSVRTQNHNFETTASKSVLSRESGIAKINCRRNTNARQQTVDAQLEARAEALMEIKNKKKTSTKTDSRQERVVSITTRQIKSNKLYSESKKTQTNNNNNNNSNCGDKSKKQAKHSTCSAEQFNKFLFIPIIIENLMIQLRFLIFSMLSHNTKHCGGGGGGANVRSTASKTSVGHNLSRIMNAATKFLQGSLEHICYKKARTVNTSMALYIVMYAAVAILLSQPVAGDDGDTFFPINGIETTTPEFDYASRGQKKFGDKCDNTLECGFPGSICDPKKKSCQCTEDLPVTNHIDKCGKEAAVNESCFFNEQCEVKYFQTECRDQRCVCRFDMTPIWLKDGSVECKGRGDKKGPETYIDPAMIGVLIGMALMFIIICVVLRLFSQARWRENRTIFNTPNPRLMNVSLLRESKLLHGQERRGSRMSVRAPSRQPSMASLRPHSPNPSLGKTGSRSNSHGSNASATSLRSTRSNSVSPAGIAVGNNSHHERKGSTYQPHQHPHQQQKLQPIQQQQEQPQLAQTNIISNPVAETVTVEIIEPEK